MKSVLANLIAAFPYSFLLANYYNTDAAHFTREAMKAMDSATRFRADMGEHQYNLYLARARRQQELAHKYHAHYMHRMDSTNYDEFGYCGPRV